MYFTALDSKVLSGMKLILCSLYSDMLGLLSDICIFYFRKEMYQNSWIINLLRNKNINFFN